MITAFGAMVVGLLPATTAAAAADPHPHIGLGAGQPAVKLIAGKMERDKPRERPSFALVRKRYKQALRAGAMKKTTARTVKTRIDRAEQLSRKSRPRSAATLLLSATPLLKKSDRYQAALRKALKDLAKALTVKKRVDRTPPVTVAKTRPARPGARGWFTGPVTVTLTAVDKANGSGVRRTEHRLNDGAWTRYTGPVTISGDGSHTLAYRSIDKAGNREKPKTLTVKVDATAPVTTATYPSGNGVYGDDVPVTLSATDAASGVARTDYSLDGRPWRRYTRTVIVSGQGRHKLRYRSIDKAGNVEKTKVVTVTISASGVPLTVTASSRCVGTSAHVAVTAVNEAAVPADLTLSSPYGSATATQVAPGKQAYQSFNTRAGQIDAGTVTVTGTATIGGKKVTSSYQAAYSAISCG